jgi:hypothetical protein
VANDPIPADTVVLDAEAEPADGAPADVEVLEDSGDVVRARVDAEGAGYLVLADAVQSDWTVTVDGTEAEIVDADHAFGAVHVPAGVHEVSYAYTPRGGTEGVAASGVGLAALALMALPPSWARRTRRDDRHPVTEPLPEGGVEDQKVSARV